MADTKIKDAPNITPKSTYKIPVGNTEFDDARTITLADFKAWLADLNGGGGWSWLVITDKPNLVEVGNVATINGQSILGGGNIQVVATTIDWNNVVGKPTIPENTSDLNNDSQFITLVFAQTYLQEKLVSGVNLATINGYNLLTGGNIVIQGGGGGGNVNWAQIGSYTPAFGNITDEGNQVLIPMSLKPIVVENSQTPNLALNDGYLYLCDEITSLDFTLNPPQSNDYVAEYHLIFSSGATPTTINWAGGLKFTDGNTPTIESGKTYEINIINNCVLIQSYV